MAQVRAKINKIRYQLILKLDTKANLTDVSKSKIETTAIEFKYS